MTTLYIIFIIVLLGTLLSKILRPIFKPYTLSQLRKSREDEIYTSTELFDINNVQEKMSRRMFLIEMSEDLEIDVNNKLTRLDSDKTAKDIRKIQMLYFSTVLVLAVIAKFAFGNVFAVIIAMLSIYAWKYPIIRIDKDISDRNDAIEKELPEMYSIMYYVYRRNASSNLTSKVQSYIRDSSDLFYKEMMLFVEDSRNGEIYALQQFKKRVPLPIVARFCDIMESRLVGIDNISVMENFKLEMDEKRSARSDKILRDLKEKLNVISWTGIMVPVGIILTIYFAAQMMSLMGNQ